MCDSPVPARHPYPQGFTIVELMITLTIVVILIAVVAPTVGEAMMSIRITGQNNDLMSDLALARSEAARRNVPVVVCSSSNGTTCTNSAWSQGWVVYPDVVVDGSQATDGTERAIKARRALEGENALVLKCAGAAERVTYSPLGSAGGMRAFTLCDSRTADKAGRTITINATGRPIASRATCPITIECP